MLRFTDVNLKLISDIEKYQFVESTIREGISMICKGYAEANNKFLKSCDANKPTSYNIYLDANSFYEQSMMQFFPTKILDWINPKDRDNHMYCQVLNYCGIKYCALVLRIVPCPKNS